MKIIVPHSIPDKLLAIHLKPCEFTLSQVIELLLSEPIKKELRLAEICQVVREKEILEQDILYERKTTFENGCSEEEITEYLTNDFRKYSYQFGDIFERLNRYTIRQWEHIEKEYIKENAGN